jgi:hypothetical protein
MVPHLQESPRHITIAKSELLLFSGLQLIGTWISITPRDSQTGLTYPFS